MSGPTVGELFAGYGGIGRGLKSIWPEARTAWVSDIDPGPRKVLAHRFPDAPNLGDITAIDWAAVEPVDIITGGSPCQDLSHAGKRAGMRSGTRSGLWASMCDAIETLRPSLVVWENVRGAYSAEADSNVEPCPLCVGDEPGTTLRALGRVLGDLSEIGYDAAWTGLRAADVGACHGRFRVFVLAWPADSPGVGREWRWASRSRRAGLADGGRAPLGLPTPRATDGTKGGPNQRGSSGDLMLPSAVALLPTVKATNNENRQTRSDTFHAGPNLGEALLPTPAVNDMGKAYTPDEWDEWTEAQKAKHGNGNGHGKSLEIEAARLTKGDGDDRSSDEAAGQDVPGMRGDVQQKAVRETARGRDALPEQGDLLAGVREREGRDSGGLVPDAGEEGEASQGVRGMLGDRAPARPPHRPGRDEQLAKEPGGAVRVVPPATPLAGGSRCSHGGYPCGSGAFGVYAPAIHRWEGVLGRPAPSPTEPTGREGAHRLSVHLTEFMMGLPAGWVTDVPGISRNEALKLCGNGVVPQQCAEAVRWLLDVRATSLERAA